MKFCKWVLKVSKSTINEMAYGELGRFPLILEKKVHIVKYWLKIVLGELRPQVQKIYKMMLHIITADNTIVKALVNCQNSRDKGPVADPA